MKRIGIDARFYSPTATGIGRHVFELVKNLGELDTKNEYVVFLRQKDFDNFKKPAGNFTAKVADYPHYSFSEQISFGRQINKEKVDLMLFPHFNVPLFYQGKFLVTIHDLTIHFYPGKKSNFLKFWLYKKIIKHAASKATHVFSVSENTKKDIVEILKISPEKISVVGNGISSSFTKVENLDGFREKYGLPEKYFLYTGVFRDHKNILGLVHAFNIFVRENKNTNLVLSGPIDDIYVPEIKELIAKLGLEDRIMFTGFFPEKDFGKLFSAASAFVFPSFYEGFGVPPLAAMACEVPVICSNSSSLPEVCGDAALFFDPKNTEEMAEKMDEVLNDKVRVRLIQRGKDQMQKFSWLGVAEKYFLVMNND